MSDGPITNGKDTRPIIDSPSSSSPGLNGQGGVGPGARYSPEAWAQFQELAANALMVRQDWLKTMTDPRRDVEESCGYPALNGPVSVELYKQLYDRDPIAARVVEIMPKECWQVQPLVYEDEDGDKPTEFEEAWDELGGHLFGGGTWYKSEEGSVIWEYLQRVDVLSGIGQFGVLLIGLDDGMPLHAPAGGTMVVHRKAGVVQNADGTSHAHIVPQRVPMPEDSPITNAEAEALRAGKMNGRVVPLNEGEEQAVKDMVRHREWRKDRDKEEAVRIAKANYDATHPDVVVRQGVPTDNAGGFTGGGQSRSRYESTQEPTKGATTLDGKGINYASSISGTDQQYFGVQFGDSEAFADKPSKVKNQLLFIRAFDEPLVQIVRYEWNVRNPRFGMPVMYRVTLNDPREAHSGVGLPLATVFVHWSRVIHVADNLGSSEIFGKPRQQQVLNNILGLRKLYCGSPEMYWRGAFPGIALSTHPQLGGDVIVDKSAVRDSMENYFNDLQRYLLLSGMDAKTLAPTTVDPGPHINVQLEAICVKLGIPMKKFTGSQGKGSGAGGGLGQNNGKTEDGDWNDKLRNRQQVYLTPRIIVPFVDRMIQLGVLPEPEQYCIEWPDLNEVDKAVVATTALTNTQAMGAYVTQGVEALVSPLDYLTKFIGLDDEEAQSIIDAAESAHEDAQDEVDQDHEDMLGEQDAQASGPPEMQDSGQKDENGQPIMTPKPPPPKPPVATALPGRPPEDIQPDAPEAPPPVPPGKQKPDGGDDDGDKKGSKDKKGGGAAKFKITPI